MRNSRSSVALCWVLASALAGGESQDAAPVRFRGGGQDRQRTCLSVGIDNAKLVQILFRSRKWFTQIAC